jgi:hypothetical protein
VAWQGAVTSDEAFLRARQRASPWFGRRDPGVLPLVDLVSHNDRPTWVYEVPDGVSARALLAGPLGSTPDGLPPRVALELCAKVAHVMQALGEPAWDHPGPELGHVLVSAGGRLQLSHLGGPDVRTPARREPRGRVDAVGAVWRVGVLLAELLTGLSPLPSPDFASHEASNRRLAIRLLSRPGAPVPDVVRSWVLAMLAWEPLDRPLLLRVGPGLEELAATLGGPNHLEFLATRVPELRGRIVPPSLPPPPDIRVVTQPMEVISRPEPTEEVVVVGELPDRDDVTALSAETDPEVLRRFDRSEQGAIPVGVGPPVELLRKIPTLPPTLFSDLTDTPGVGLAGPPPALGRAVLGAGILFLAGAVLCAYLLLAN